jgi:hypothetical protein
MLVWGIHHRCSTQTSKRAVNFKESEMSSFCSKMAQVIKQQREDIRAAILNRGPYKLVANYSHLQLLHEKWFHMSAERLAYLAKFDMTKEGQECSLLQEQP